MSVGRFKLRTCSRSMTLSRPTSCATSSAAGDSLALTAGVVVVGALAAAIKDDAQPGAAEAGRMASAGEPELVAVDGAPLHGEPEVVAMGGAPLHGDRGPEVVAPLAGQADVVAGGAGGFCIAAATGGVGKQGFHANIDADTMHKTCLRERLTFGFSVACDSRKQSIM